MNREELLAETCRRFALAVDSLDLEHPERSNHREHIVQTLAYMACHAAWKGELVATRGDK